MIKAALAQCAKWDKIYYFNSEDLGLNLGDFIVMNTDLGLSLANIFDFEELEDTFFSEVDCIKNFVRKANEKDLDKFAKLQGQDKQKAFLFCKDLIRKLNLEMKLVDVFYSLDRKRLTFAFTADGRIDFRELVKLLAKEFHCAIRLQQIGVRDETRFSSDIGICGQQTCCTRFLKELGNVNSDFAELQQISHRGAERLSGICGRLACCLKYEQKVYEELSKDFPKIGANVILKTGVKAEVVGWNVLQKQIIVEIKTDDSNDVSANIKVNLDDIRKILS